METSKRKSIKQSRKSLKSSRKSSVGSRKSSLGSRKSIKDMNNDEKLAWFRKKLLIQKPLNTLLNQYFDSHKDATTLIIPMTAPLSPSDKIDLYFNCKCENFPQCIYDFQEIIQTFIRLNYSRKNLFSCKGCEKPIDFKFFFKDQSLQDQIDLFWREHNIINKGKFCKELQISRAHQIDPVLVTIETQQSQTVMMTEQQQMMMSETISPLPHLAKPSLSPLFTSPNQILTLLTSPGQRLSLLTEKSQYDGLEHYPKFNSFHREAISELLFKYEHNIRKKPDLEVLGNVYGNNIRNKDIKLFIDSCILSKKMFRTLLMYFYNNIHSENKEIIFMTLKPNNSYKLDENLGCMKTSEELRNFAILNFFIRCAKKPKIFTFCTLNVQKSLLKFYFPYSKPQRDSNLAIFMIESLIKFIKQQFAIEVAGLSLIFMGFSGEKDPEFGIFTLFHYYSFLENKTEENINYKDYLKEFPLKIIGFLLFVVSLGHQILRTNSKNPKNNEFIDEFNEKFPLNAPDENIVINKTHHEISWKSQNKPFRMDIFKKIETTNKHLFEIIPSITSDIVFTTESSNPNIIDKYWNLGVPNKKTFDFFDIKESVKLKPLDLKVNSKDLRKFWKGFLGEKEEFKKFWAEGLTRKETPLIPFDDKKPIIKKANLNENPNFEKIIKKLMNDEYIPPINLEEKKIEIFDFNQKEIKLKKTDLLNLMKQVKNEGIFEVKLQEKSKNPEMWQEPPKIIEELGPAHVKDPLVAVKKTDLKKILLEKEKKVLEKIQNEEEQNLEEYRKKYDGYVENFQNQMRFNYILGYYYFTNPPLYEELFKEYQDRLENKTKGKKEVVDQVFNKTDFQKKEEEKTIDEDEFFLNNLLSTSKQIDKNEFEKAAKKSVKPAELLKIQNQNSSEQGKPAMSKIVSANCTSIDAPIFTTKTPINNVEIIAQIGDLQVKREEYQRFRSTMFLSENMLNFLIRYLNEKHLYNLKKDYTSVEFRIQCLPTDFMKALASKTENAFLKSFLKNKTRNFFKKCDFLLIPFYIYQDRCVMIFCNLVDEKMLYFDNFHQITSGRDCSNDPYIELVRNFLDNEYKNTFLKPSKLYEWKFVYQNVENIRILTKTSLMIARYLYVIYNMRSDFDTEEIQMKDFHKKLCEFYMTVGVNKKKLRSKNFVL